MYADDMVLLAPATSALQQLLRECHNFENAHDMLFNPKQKCFYVFKKKNAIVLNSPPGI